MTSVIVTITWQTLLAGAGIMMAPVVTALVAFLIAWLKSRTPPSQD